MTNLLNRLRDGILTEASPQVTQPPDMNVSLKAHQLAMIRAMMQVEDGEITIQNGVSGRSTVGVLGDSVGMGKSYTVVGLIMSRPSLPTRRSFTRVMGGYRTQVVITREALDTTPVGCNVIVSPHGAVYQQWVEYLEQAGLDDVTRADSAVSLGAFEQGLCWARVAVGERTRCSCSHCSPVTGPGTRKRKHSLVPTFHEGGRLRLPSVILVNSSNYNRLASLLSGYSVSRVFVDEADSINIPAMAPIDCEMLWAVTASVHNIAYASGAYYDYSGTVPVRRITDGIRSTGFIRNVFRSIQYDSEHSDFIFLKCTDAFAKSSFSIPDYTVKTYLCRSPFYVSALQDMFGNEVREMLNAGDVQSAIQRIGWHTTGDQNLYESVKASVEASIQERRLRVDYLRSHPNLTEQERERRISVVEERIRGFQLQLTRFEEKVSNSDELCPVCYDVAGQSTPRCTTMCCNNIFCMGCLHEALRSTRGKCPMCRAPCAPSSCVVDSSGHRPSPDQPPGKVEQLLDILRETEGSRVLIFSSWDASYETVKDRLPGESRLHRLCGNSNQMKATLQRFVSGDRKLMWINSSNFGSGINLQAADHVIIYHKMSGDLTSQIIGRAQRSGRTTPLVVHQLCHSNE